MDMENEKIGPFIRQLRKDRNLTQKELAAMLNVTDKAVSKWELSASLPDVALLLPLAEALGVSVTELLGGVRTPASPAKGPESPPQDTAGDILSYTRKTSSQRREILRLWLFAGVSGAFLLAALVCWICDTALNGLLSWSLIVDISLLLCWVVLLPLLTARRHALPLALGALSAVTLPYLYLLGRLLRDPRVFRFGLPITPAAVVYLWTIWAVWRRFHRRRLIAAGITLLLTAAVSLFINAVTKALAGTGSRSLCGDSLVTLVLAAVCFLAEFLRRRTKDHTGPA